MPKAEIYSQSFKITVPEYPIVETLKINEQILNNIKQIKVEYWETNDGFLTNVKEFSK